MTLDPTAISNVTDKRPKHAERLLIELETAAAHDLEAVAEK